MKERINNRFKKAAAKIAAAILTAVMIVQPVVPVTEAQAATHTANRMLEIPVSFQTDQTYISSTNFTDYVVPYTFTGNSTDTLTFECSGADIAPDSRLNCKFYIPVDYFESDESMAVVGMSIAVWNTETHKCLWGSHAASVGVSRDGVLVFVRLNGVYDFYSISDVAEQFDSALDVQMEEKGDFYEVTINSAVDMTGDNVTAFSQSGATDIEDVKVYFSPSIYGFSMDVPDGNVYIDDVTFTTASNETLHTEDFENAEDVLDIWTYVYDGSGNKTTIKKLNVETIYDNELLTTLKSKISVKKGKKKSLSAYVNAVSTDEVTYKSSNKKVATVNSKGVVKGKKKGTATITVTANGVKKKIKVTVK